MQLIYFLSVLLLVSISLAAAAPTIGKHRSNLTWQHGQSRADVVAIVHAHGGNGRTLVGRSHPSASNLDDGDVVHHLHYVVVNQRVDVSETADECGAMKLGLESGVRSKPYMGSITVHPRRSLPLSASSGLHTPQNGRMDHMLTAPSIDQMDAGNVKRLGVAGSAAGAGDGDGGGAGGHEDSSPEEGPMRRHESTGGDDMNTASSNARDPDPYTERATAVNNF